MTKPATPEQLRAALIEACDAIEGHARLCFIFGPAKPNDPNREQELHDAWVDEDPDDYVRWVRLKGLADSPRFQQTYCSQCGGEQGPGNAGFSHCADHRIRSAA